MFTFGSKYGRCKFLQPHNGSYLIHERHFRIFKSLLLFILSDIFNGEFVHVCHLCSNPYRLRIEVIRRYF